MRLHVGGVHIWLADLDAVGAKVEGLLDEREQERAARIVREPVRRRWMAARGVLRAILGDYLGEHPRTLRFAQEAGGKPTLDFPDGGTLCFNLSHSGGLAVYALSQMGPVGVDVELVARHPNVRARPRDPRARPREPRTHSQDFLRAWVRGEAEGKRRGVGMAGMAPAGGSQPWIAELDLGREAVGAVALATEPVDFQVYPIDFRACGSILQQTHHDP